GVVYNESKLISEVDSFDYSGKIFIVRLNTDGSIDTTFGENGVTITEFSDEGLINSAALKINIQKIDGQEKIIMVCGCIYGGDNLEYRDNLMKLAFCRYNPLRITI
ncbi:MAG: hypothetical protein EBQ92_09115, partial [Proteobacteria bacterium]|nr:hypothetical protein [Pseudomonadota bacterium]